MTSLTVLSVLLFITCCCLHHIHCSIPTHVPIVKEQRDIQRQQHWNQKHQQQHSNYKQQIQQQRQGTFRYAHKYQKRPVYHYKKPVYHYKGKRYHYKKKYKYVKWPRIRGRCEPSPWVIDGVNPVMEEAAKGNIVLLYMLKVNDGYSFKQLIKMNDMAEHYR